MIPANFPERTAELTKPPGMTDEECGSLQVYQDGQSCLSSWRANWRERMSILLFGKVWVWVYSGNTQPPIALLGMKTPFIQVKHE